MPRLGNLKYFNFLETVIKKLLGGMQAVLPDSIIVGRLSVSRASLLGSKSCLCYLPAVTLDMLPNFSALPFPHPRNTGGNSTYTSREFLETK